MESPSLHEKENWIYYDLHGKLAPFRGKLAPFRGNWRHSVDVHIHKIIMT